MQGGAGRLEEAGPPFSPLQMWQPIAPPKHLCYTRGRLRFVKEPVMQHDEWRDFLWTLRRALLLIVRWIEKKYPADAK